MRLLLSTLILAGCATVKAPDRAPDVGPLAPDFDEITVDGREVSLSSLRGQIVVLHFWAKWCGACEGDLEAFQDLHEKYSPEGVVVVGIAHASGPDQEIWNFAEAVGFDFPNIQATDELRDAYNAAVFPTTVLVDRAGHIRYRTNARVDPRYWDQLVADLLKETSP